MQGTYPFSVIQYWSCHFPWRYYCNIAQRVHDFVCLGALFMDSSSTHTIVKRAIATVMATVKFKQLQLFWKHGRILVGWKLVVFTAVIRTKLSYTLEFLRLLNSHLDAFYYKCLLMSTEIGPTCDC
eukprot:3032506-Amphidinium_carterae.1